MAYSWSPGRTKSRPSSRVVTSVLLTVVSPLCGMIMNAPGGNPSVTPRPQPDQKRCPTGILAGGTVATVRAGDRPDVARPREENSP